MEFKMNIIGYSDYYDTTLEGQLKFAKEINLNEIIIRKYNDKLIYEIDELDILNINNDLKREKINIFALDPLIKKEDYYSEDTLEKYIQTIKIANSIKVKNIILRLPKIEDILIEFDTIKIHIDELLVVAKSNRVNILIKQEEDNNNILAYIIKRYNDKYLNIIFSPKDAILSQDSAISGYRVLKNYFNTFIAADIDSLNNPELLGYGRVDILNLFKRMKRDKYNGNIILDDTFISFFKDKKNKKVPLLKKLFNAKSLLDKYIEGYSLRILDENSNELVNIIDIYKNQINVLNIVFN